MEIGFSVGLFTATRRTVMAFVVPLTFSAILQNLVVKVCGVERHKPRRGLRQVQDQGSPNTQRRIDKVVRQRRLLVTKNVSNETILGTCRFYAKDEAGFDSQVKRTENIENESKSIEYIVWLVNRAGMWTSWANL